MEFERDVMEEKRQTLSKMLMQLMDQKADRAKELQDRLKELDNTRSEDMENYWLIQYQKLLDSKPKVKIPLVALSRLHLNSFCICVFFCSRKWSRLRPKLSPPWKSY